ncbi:ankyrin repeat domain-containing protein 66 isoform X2 [Patella vulgata]|nr:ankyrin repeat domain-containing protein 66 isoform X2 [Patella vulgata]XP_050401927.1 ankyrin repeat domain-containing protein 66 isoform X2 [Patella vulgata]XP_050401928.1 ankyrin repeat domain-containing protein 66 isoform X2 [Patella vulgata]
MDGLKLHDAAATGDRDAMEDLLKSEKIDINLADEEYHNYTALHWACSKGYSECVRLLLEFGAKGTSRSDQGWTPAHCAAETGRTPALRALYSAGVSVHKKDKYGDTPRRIATIYGHADCVKFLIQAGAEMAAKRQQGESDSDDSSDDETNAEKSEP